MPTRRILILLLSALAKMLPAEAQPTCPMVKMQVERLPDLNIPRTGHAVFCVGGEVVAAGGHTNSFVPTATAEYYSDGAWHLMQMAYPHDQGATAVTAAGEVLLIGGHEKELGIGQTFTLERYDAATHSFRGFGCLDKKRCFANALPMDSGRIVISGNWFTDDGIELYDGSRQNKYVKPVSQHRSLPHILRTARDNAIMFSARDHHAEDFDTIIIDRLKGEPFTVPLFETWRPFCYPLGYHGSCFIGDETKGDYTSLIQVTQGDSLMAVARVEGEMFSLLPTTCPIPMRSQWGRITWLSHIIADHKAGRAYIMGYGEDRGDETGDHRFYVAVIDYLQSPAPITLLYSEPQDSVGRYQPVLTDDGALMVVGGYFDHHNNYDPSATVLLLYVNTEKPSLQESQQPLWLWIVFASLLFAAIVATAILLRHRKKPTPSDDALQQADTITTASDEELMERICRYMEEQRPYLNSELKVQDVADALGSNRTYISTCIKSARGCSFTQFVNSYRVEHAQQLLKRDNGMKLLEIWTASGFSSESSFFRAFKVVTGTTPKDWIA